MVEISINGEQLHLEVQGLDKLWSFRGKLEIPLRPIGGVRPGPEAAGGWWHGIKVMGTNVPGVITAGTFIQHGQKVFWDVHDPHKTIIIELHDETYADLIIEVDNPETLS